jgi:hypothetical protein
MVCARQVEGKPLGRERRNPVHLTLPRAPPWAWVVETDERVDAQRLAAHLASEGCVGQLEVGIVLMFPGQPYSAIVKTTVPLGLTLAAYNLGSHPFLQRPSTGWMTTPDNQEAEAGPVRPPDARERGTVIVEGRSPTH